MRWLDGITDPCPFPTHVCPTLAGALGPQQSQAWDRYQLGWAGWQGGCTLEAEGSWGLALGPFCHIPKDSRSSRLSLVPQPCGVRPGWPRVPRLESPRP